MPNAWGWRWQVASVDPLVVYVHNDGLARLATKVNTVSAHRAVMKFPPVAVVMVVTAAASCSCAEGRALIELTVVV